MLCEIQVDNIVGNVYDIKDKLKALKCKWSSAGKCWTITKETDVVGVSEALQELNEKQKQKLVECWQKACNVNNIKFVKKNEPDYDKVYKTFKDLLHKK